MVYIFFFYYVIRLSSLFFILQYNFVKHKVVLFKIFLKYKTNENFEEVKVLRGLWGLNGSV